MLFDPAKQSQGNDTVKRLNVITLIESRKTWVKQSVRPRLANDRRIQEIF